jgi:hypothetical protein
MTFCTCLALRSDRGSKTSWPASVCSFSTKAASGLEFSEAMTTAPLHPMMPGNSLVMAPPATGIISALSGLKNDRRTIQVTAPVQPGNSGGPLLGENGSVVGVVVGKLDALKVAEVIGDLPQNVNFAVSLGTLQSFLNANDVPFVLDDSPATKSPPNIAAEAARYTVLLECGAPDRNAGVPALPAMQTDQAQPAPAVQSARSSRSLWDHNGSLVYLTAQGSTRRFYYDTPLPGLDALEVRPGSLLFEGRKVGEQYIGTAYIFSKGCSPKAFAASGPVKSDSLQISVSVSGKAPLPDANCKQIGVRDEVLFFSYKSNTGN